MTNGSGSPAVPLTTLGKNWWMVAGRGLLAILLGLVILLRPTLSLNLLVATFGVYALLDGAWAVASALWVSRMSFGAWPVVLEGLVSLGVGWLALTQPLMPREAVMAIALWGLLIGVLEGVAAARLPRRLGGYWLLMTGAAFSLFLAVIILMLPYAGHTSVAVAVGWYALVFGALLVAGAVSLRKLLSEA